MGDADGLGGRNCRLQHNSWIDSRTDVQKDRTRVEQWLSNLCPPGFVPAQVV